MSIKMHLFAAAAIMAVAPAANAATVVATFTGGIGGTIVRNIVSGAGAPQYNAAQTVDRFNMDLTGGNYTNRLVGDSLVDFYAWCVEPRETITAGQSITYTVLPLSQAATNIGGIGSVKANQLFELFGRFNPNLGASVTAVKAAALQVAIWEIVRETPGAALNLSTGNIYFDAGSESVAGTYNLAASYLAAIDGTGPKATNLRVLSNGVFGLQGGGTQDLLVQAVPEPESWAMLIVGFGLVGAAARRRAHAIAA